MGWVWGFLSGSMVKNPPAMRETQVWSLGWEDPLEKETATQSSVPAWRIPFTEEPGRLQSMGLQRVRHDLVSKQQQWGEFGNFSGQGIYRSADKCKQVDWTSLFSYLQVDLCNTEQTNQDSNSWSHGPLAKCPLWVFTNLSISPLQEWGSLCTGRNASPRGERSSPFSASKLDTLVWGLPGSFSADPTEAGVSPEGTLSRFTQKPNISQQ